MRTFVIAVLLCFVGRAFAQTPERIALVIGNSNYEVGVWKLENPKRDAEDMAAILDALQYDVTLVTDADRETMERAINAFGDRMRRIGPTAETVFFYAGHGAQDDGQNYLIPVDASPSTLEELRFQSPPVALLFDDMRQTRNLVNVVLLDACRDMPLPEAYTGIMRTRSTGRDGLAPIQDTPNIFLGFAAAPGQTASDGDGENSPFTAALKNRLSANPQVPVSLLFERVAVDVIEATRGAQRPEFRWGLSVVGWDFLTGGIDPKITPDLQTKSSGLMATLIDSISTRRSLIEELNKVRHLDPLRDCEDCPPLIALKGGEFQMGASDSESDERPIRTISLQPFAIGVAEITFEEWEACVNADFCQQIIDIEGWGRGDQPVYNVSWQAAQGYLNWLSQETQLAYRLPTEAEWEYAARAGVQTAYPFGNDRPSGTVNCADCLSQNSNVKPRRAVSNPNGFGLYNTIGNLGEWVQDCYRTNLRRIGDNGAAYDKKNCSHRVTRGGSFAKGAMHVKHSSRERTRATTQSFTIGFRVARDLPEGVRAGP